VPPLLPAGTLSGREQPHLAASAVTLRSWTTEDVAALVSAYGDPDIQRWHCRSLTDDEAAARILQWRAAWNTDTSASWAVTDRWDGRVLGSAGFRDVDLSAGVAEVAYWVLPGARGRGVATAAVTTLSRWAFDEIGFQRLELLHSTENVPSCKVAAASGFSVEGTLRQSVLHTDGWHDMHLHARLRTDPRPPDRAGLGATTRSQSP
jgi:ribosomal-protein-alanine N-acetyltransferase